MTVWRDQKQFTQTFSRGLAQTQLTEGPAAPAAHGRQQRRGTQVRFVYDETIFSKTCVGQVGMVCLVVWLLLLVIGGCLSAGRSRFASERCGCGCGRAFRSK